MSCGPALPQARTGPELSLRGRFHHIYVRAIAAFGERHHAICRSKQREIGSHADVFARKKLRPSLTDDDVSGAHDLAAIYFDAQALGIAVTTVSCAAKPFFVGEELKIENEH